MANWNLPTVTSGYLDFVAEMNAKFVDAGTMNFGAPTNLPIHAMRFNRSTNAFEEWDGAAWNPKVIGITSGGTGASDAANARINLGIGSMGTQNSNAVAITGGTMTGVNIDAGYINSGVLPLARGGTGNSLAIAPYGFALLSNGAVVNFWGNENLINLNASNLSTGSIPLDRNTPGHVNGYYPAQMNELFRTINQTVFAGPSGRYTVAIDTNYATLNMVSNTGPADRKIWRLYNDINGLHIQFLNDAYTTGYDALRLTYEGYVIGYGGQLTNLHGPSITTGLINPAVMGAGAPNGGNFLRGDGVWAVPSLAPVDPIPSGLIAIFDTGCPTGWTRVAALDNRFPIGSTVWGSQGGSASHQHSVSGNTDAAGSHSHGVSASGSGGGNAAGDVVGQTADANTNQTADAGGSIPVIGGSHRHNVGIHIDIPVNVNVNVNGSTDNQGNHAHSFSGFSSVVDQYPPYTSVIFCRKN